MPQGNDFRQAQIFVTSLPRGVAVPEVERSKYPITAAMASYVLDFESAKQKHTLHQFDVQRRLDTIRRLPSEIYRFSRSLAGLLILGGLLTTLIMLSRAVGPLGDAFQDLSKDQASSITPAPISAEDQVSQIQTTMRVMTRRAGLAFGLSFTFILGATVIIFSVAVRQRKRTILIAQFAGWAERAYRDAVPGQVSIGEAAAAFRQNAEALGSLTQSFNDLSFALEAVKGFSNTMEDVREAIVKALDRIPGEIQASMGTVSKDMVKNLERAMKDDVEATKKILAIYGQQEFRIDEIAKHVSAVKELSEKATAAVTTLEAIPQYLNAIDASLKQHTSVVGQIEASSRRIEESVLAFPSEELKTSAKALIDATNSVGRAHTQAVSAIVDLQRQTAIVATTDLEVGKHLERITAASQQFLNAYEKLTANFDSSQIRVAEGLDRVATQIQREIKQLVDKTDVAAISAQLQRLQLAFDEFHKGLRLMRTPTLTDVSVQGGGQGNGEHSSGGLAAFATVEPNPQQQVGSLGTTIPDRMFSPSSDVNKEGHEIHSGIIPLKRSIMPSPNPQEDEPNSRDQMTHAEEL
jgi:hypothetical protein